MERSFARSKRYGYKRARWRGLWRLQIQEYLTAAIQNILVLTRNIKEHNRPAAVRQAQPRAKYPLFIINLINGRILTRQIQQFLTVVASFKNIHPFIFVISGFNMYSISLSRDGYGDMMLCR